MKTINEVWKLVENFELIQVHIEEMEAIYKRVFEFEKPFVVEIGSAHGASSTILAEAVKELQGHLICIDHFPENYYSQALFGSYAKAAFLKNTAPYRDVMEHVEVNSHQAIRWLRGGTTIDVLFVDGDHEYDGVKKDCEDYMPLIKSGGYMAFHDYNNVGFGVKKAVDEMLVGWEKSDDVWDLAIFKKP